jgi:hypothetical protein
MNLVDTLAEVHHYRGEHDRAIALEKEALAQEPDNAGFARNLSRFEKRGSEPSPEVGSVSVAGTLFAAEAPFPMPPAGPAEIARRQFAHEGGRVAAACAASWPKDLDEAWVRITLGKSAHAEAVELLDRARRRRSSTASATRCAPSSCRPIRRRRASSSALGRVRRRWSRVSGGSLAGDGATRPGKRNFCARRQAGEHGCLVKP